MKIISFGNSGYKRVAHNWALYLQSHGIDNYTIYSLDSEIYDYLVENKINTELLDINMFDDGFKWHLRFNQTRRLIESEDILHSDLDAIWLRNPLGFIDSSYDIVSSTGGFPHKDSLCMGWIHFSSCDAVRKVFDNLLEKVELLDGWMNIDTKKRFDDQREFNHEIDGIWRNGKIFKKPSNLHDLNIKKLGQDIVSRVKNHDINTYVAHPLSDKKCDREQLLRDKKLWILD
jgi:hypothetical protein